MYEANIHYPLLSIITVVYNGRDEIENTIKSVINQTYPNIEYLIIDGNSTDGTLDIIKKYKKHLSFWVSENDNGIYDAMNKGIVNATGKWMNFMNCGDYFINENVCSRLYANDIDKDIIFIYGNHEIRLDNNSSKVYPKPLDQFWKGMPFCHQSLFVKADWMKDNLYNLKYTYASDFHHFYNAYNAGLNFLYKPITISNFAHDGISQTKFYWIEVWQISTNNYQSKFLIRNAYFVFFLAKILFKYFLKKIFTREIYAKIKRIKKGFF